MPLIYVTDHFTMPLPEGHRFPFARYRLLREAVQAELSADAVVYRTPGSVPFEQVELVHDADYVRRVCEGTLSRQEVRRLGFPWSPELVERTRRTCGATVEGAAAALEHGLVVNLAGGTHHAFADRGEGYCIFNDVAIAVRVLRQEGLAERALVLDLDVHQGNGTAAIFAADPDVFTCSLHGAKNYPFRRETSDLDVELPDGTGDEAYLARLEEALAVVFREPPYDLVFYLAGCDVYRDDRHGRLALTADGVAARDRLVCETVQAKGLPLVIAMAGGYAREVADTAHLQAETVRLACEIWG